MGAVGTCQRGRCGAGGEWADVVGVEVGGSSLTLRSLAVRGVTGARDGRETASHVRPEWRGVEPPAASPLRCAGRTWLAVSRPSLAPVDLSISAAESSGWKA